VKQTALQQEAVPPLAPLALQDADMAVTPDTPPIDTDISPTEHVRTLVAASGSSFFWAMRFLPKPKREAMFAVYAFCREVDDIADGDAPLENKRAELAAWRVEIDRLFAGQPKKPVARALAGPVTTFGLAREDFLAMIDGMEMDAGDDLIAPSMADLRLYCARVAGAVGLLSVRIFDGPSDASRKLALTLGEALQLTNILRDLREDAERGRLYLPEELLSRHGVASRDPQTVLRDAALSGVCTDLAAEARQRFIEAEASLTALSKREYRPAVVMMQVYRRVLDRLIRRGWQRLDRKVGLHPVAKLWIALRYGLL
jgi:phytoene synthase